MLHRIFPKQIDNIYRGYWLAVWLLVPLAFVKLAMGVNTVVNTHKIITSADGIPLDTYSTGAQQNLVFMYQAWGLTLALLALLGFVALIRYRAMVPFVYLMLGIEQIGRIACEAVTFQRSAATLIGPTPAGAINLALIAALLIGFALSLGKEERDAVTS